MSTPIVEQVAAALATQVATVTTDNGYNQTIHTVVRWNRKLAKEESIVPHLYCRIETDTPEFVQLLASNPPILEMSYVFHVYVGIAPSEDDQTAVETYEHTVAADVIKAVASEFDAGNDLDTLVREWNVLPHVSWRNEDNSQSGVDVQFQAIIRTSETTPFTQR